jgi:NAD(P)-dependent dehydrogenase (short-subunit alcohol dehydrogenase family)
MGRVAGKVAIVTGGASDPGLGRTAALALAREGAAVVVTDIEGAGAEKTAADIRDAGGRALALVHDVTSESRWSEVIAETASAFGRLDVLVNNAGIAVLKSIADLSLSDFERQIAVNLTSVFLGCKHAMPQMKENGGGSIVNMSSVAGLIGTPGGAAYGASKGGVRILTKCVAVEGARNGIRCNSIHPGFIWTNMQAAFVRSLPQGAIDPAQLPVPLGRMGQPEDIAHCVLYLASDESSYVTGAELTVDAGMTAI